MHYFEILVLVVVVGTQALAAENIRFTNETVISSDATSRAQYIVNKMLENSPAVRRKMLEKNFRVEIIGKDQVLSDLKDYADLKGRKTFDGRSFDQGTRGVGGVDKCSIGEENLLCLPKQKYWQEDILVHEFAHSMKSNMDVSLSLAIDHAYGHAKEKNLYPASAYIMANSQEYWAEGVQAWFGVTERTDVNGGVNTVAKLREHDPEFAQILSQVFGVTELKRLPGCRY